MSAAKMVQCGCQSYLCKADLFLHAYCPFESSLYKYTSPVQVSDAGVDTLIPLSLQGKDSTILQQLLPTLLNPAVLGESVPSFSCSLAAAKLTFGGVW